MTRKIGSCVGYLFFIAILWASFCIPDMLLERLSFFGVASVYDWGRQSGIDVEVEEIYLAKAIHDMESAEAEVCYSIVSRDPLAEYGEDAHQEEFKEIEEELLKLKECGILRDFDPIVGSGERILTEVYMAGQAEYTVKNMFIKQGDTVWRLEQEEKTGKLLSVFLCGEDIPKESEQRDLLEKYIHYLDLYIIDDWSYEDQRMKSEKAQLVVGFEKAGEGCILTIHSATVFLDGQKERNRHLSEEDLRIWSGF